MFHLRINQTSSIQLCTQLMMHRDSNTESKEFGLGMRITHIDAPNLPFSKQQASQAKFLAQLVR